MGQHGPNLPNFVYFTLDLYSFAVRRFSQLSFPRYRVFISTVPGFHFHGTFFLSNKANFENVIRVECELYSIKFLQISNFQTIHSIK